MYSQTMVRQRQLSIGSKVNVDNMHVIPVGEGFHFLMSQRPANLRYRSGWIPPARSKGVIVAGDVVPHNGEPNYVYGVKIGEDYFIVNGKGLSLITTRKR